MLAVEKENLLTWTSKEIVALREMELQYYIDHIGIIQTMATLLAGFAFSALVQSNSLGVDEQTVTFSAWSHTLTFFHVSNGSTTHEVSVPQYELVNDGWTYFAFLMHASELVSTTMCLGEMIHVISETLIARALGSRLALRGPDGSVIRSTRNLARALGSSTRTFFHGLQFFMLSVSLYALRGQHPVVAVLLIAILYRYWRGVGNLADRLSVDFHLANGVTTAFNDREDYKVKDRRNSPVALTDFKKIRNMATMFLNPVGHYLNLVVEEITNDFEGDGAKANTQHRNEGAATQYMISRTEKKQRETVTAELEKHTEKWSQPGVVTHTAPHVDDITNVAWCEINEMKIAAVSTLRAAIEFVQPHITAACTSIGTASTSIIESINASSPPPSPPRGSGDDVEGGDDGFPTTAGAPAAVAMPATPATACANETADVPAPAPEATPPPWNPPVSSLKERCATLSAIAVESLGHAPPSNALPDRGPPDNGHLGSKCPRRHSSPSSNCASLQHTPKLAAGWACRTIATI